MPVRIQLKRTAGWRMPAGCVKVARPGFWGNPFKIGVHGDAAYCVEAYRLSITLTGHEWLDHLHRHAIPEEMAAGRRQAVATLRGKTLGCWCKEGEPCHADVLLELANA